MNIVIADLVGGRNEVEKLLAYADNAVAEAIQAIAHLQANGLEAARRLGIQSGLIGEALDYAGRANAAVSNAALMLQGVHASLHEAMERLAPDDPQKAADGGGKEPPPKP